MLVPLLVICLVFVCIGACASGLAGFGRPDLSNDRALPSRYHPDRRDYASFRVAHPGLPEPNYLPFMVHRFARPGGLGDVLILCRWAPAQMPIPVWVETPTIDASVQDEFRPVRSDAYVQAVDQALELWEDALEGLVTFVRVFEPERARLRVRLVGGRGPMVAEGVRQLGTAERLVDACTVSGWDPEAERLEVVFDMPELVVHLADDAGLLPPTIVRRLVVHELGHALGMRGHSPSPGDVMYPMLRDAPGRDELSIQDVNAFVSLYSVPNGAHFVDAPEGGSQSPRPPPVPPGGGPRVDKAPYVDARHGFEINVPKAWVRIEEPHGVFFSDGPTWDHVASLRIFVWPSETLDDFMACCTRALLADAWFRRSSEAVVNGRRARRLEVEDDSGERARDLLFVELGDGRVMMVVAESPVGHEAAWRPWFDESLGSLAIWEANLRRPLLGGGAAGERAPEVPERAPGEGGAVAPGVPRGADPAEGVR